MPPAHDPSVRAEPGARGRAVVWTAGHDPIDTRTSHPLLRWFALLVLVGACAFALAYAVHALLGGTSPSGLPGSLWLPERLAPDACSGR